MPQLTRLTWTTRGTVLFAASIALVAAAGLGAGSGTRAALAVGAGVVALAAFIVDPLILALAAFLGVFILFRVGGSGNGLAVSDLVVAMATLAALTRMTWSIAGNLRLVLNALGLYACTLVLAVAVHPNRVGAVEVVHRLVMVGGSCIVGWVVAERGRAPLAARLYLAAASSVAVFAILRSAATGFQPAQLGLYQKNAIGAMMWIAIVVVQLHPSWLRLTGRWIGIPLVLCVGGLLASQSRQSVIVLVAALAIAFLVRPDVRRRSKFIFLLLIPLVIGAYLSFKTQFVVNPKFNSVAIRLDQLRSALAIWHLDPWFGQGPNFYNVPAFAGVPVPPNIVIGELAATGLVGLWGLGSFFVATLAGISRLPRQVLALALVVFAGHFLEGLFDIFWIGASTASPFLVIGLCLGIADRDLAAERVAPPRLLLTAAR